MVNNSLDKLLYPKKIAVIGASRDAKKVGGVIFHNIIRSNYKGEVFAVNPHATRIFKHKSYDSVLDIEGNIDLAIISIPQKYVLESLQECGQKGIKNVVVISAGYAEAGANGFGRELKLIEVAQKFQINLLGPNCLGFINSSIDLNATFSHTIEQKKENIAFISQSGAMGTSFIDWANERKLGMSHFVSLGNKSDLNENDFVKFFAQDDSVDMIMLYIEDFADGREFYELAKSITKDKPIVVLKPGVSEEAKKAIASHTGSIAQNEKIIDRALKDSGCIRVTTVEELFYITTLLCWQPLPSGNRTVIITNAGGVGIQSVDDLGNNGLQVPHLSPATQKKLKAVLPEAASTKNPVDLLGDALADRYEDSIEAVITDGSVDSILVLLTPQLMTQSLRTARVVNSIADKHNKTVLTSFVGGGQVKEGRENFNKERIPHFNFPNDAARMLGLVWEWAKYKKDKGVKNSRLNYPVIVNSTLESKSESGMLELEDAHKLFKEFGLPLLESSVVHSEAEAQKVGRKIGFPLVIKLAHPELVHKTEFRAVKYPINGADELRRAYSELDSVAVKHKLQGAYFELQPYIDDKLEIIIGVSKDEDTYRSYRGSEHIKTKGFGHILVFGTGGIHTEIYKDVSMKLLPITLKDAKELVDNTKMGDILDGSRGKSYYIKGVWDLLVGVSKLIEKNKNITAIDINPLFVTKDKVYIVDLKVFV